MNFIWKIFHDKNDESVHRQFIRFGKGEFGGRAILNLWKTRNNIKIKSSFEFANDFVLFVSWLGKEFSIEKFSVEGFILSKKDISNIMSENQIKGNSETKKGGLYYQNNIVRQELSKDQLSKLERESYFSLLNIDGLGIKLKIKDKLPKPGKSEDKVDDKFCQLELDGKYYHAAKEDFFWDLPECKKAGIEHRYIITEIVLPKTNEKDYAKIREMARRKGKIIRIINADGKEIKSEKS